MAGISRIAPTRIMHRAVRHNGVLYLGGVTADDTTKDMTEQTRQVCAKIDALLQQCGSDRTKLLAATIFITDMSAKEAMNTAWLDWIDAADLPVRATVGVRDLGTPTTLVEIVVTAAA